MNGDEVTKHLSSEYGTKPVNDFKFTKFNRLIRHTF